MTVREAAADASAILADACWLPLRLSDDFSRLTFVRLDRDDHRAVRFLEEKFIPDSAPRAVVAVDRIAAGPAIAHAAPRFIFHSSMAGSTLLARVLDQPGSSMSLAEPIILNQLSARFSRGEEIGPLLDLVVALLSRPFGPRELVVIKPGNTANNLMPLLAARFPEMRAVTMEAPVRDLLATVAKNGGHGRMIYRRLYAFVARTRRLSVELDPESMWELTDLEVAAYAWTLQHAEFLDMLTANPGQFRHLESARLFAREPALFAALRDFFGLGEDFAPSADDPVFTRHAKNPGLAYDARRRSADMAQLKTHFADEIERGARFAEELAGEAGIPLELPNPL